LTRSRRSCRKSARSRGSGRGQNTPTIARVHDYWLDGKDDFAVEPGVVPTTQWRPGPGADTGPLPGWTGVARKPAR
jgi:hypothetical protein